MHRQLACFWVALMVLVVVSDFSNNELSVVGVLSPMNFSHFFVRFKLDNSSWWITEGVCWVVPQNYVSGGYFWASAC